MQSSEGTRLKRSKFIHYAPHIAVMNNLEFDHADIFDDVSDVKRTFFHLSRLVPRNGWIVVNGDDANLAALGSFGWTRLVRVGLGENCDVRLTDFVETPESASFTLNWKGTKWADVKWAQPGLSNARNAAMAATAAQLSLAPVPAGEALPADLAYYARNGAALARGARALPRREAPAGAAGEHAAAEGDRGLRTPSDGRRRDAGEFPRAFSRTRDPRGVRAAEQHVAPEGDGTGVHARARARRRGLPRGRWRARTC